MTEIRKTLAILGARWAEVTFVIGFGLLVSLFSGILESYEAYCSWKGLTCIGLLLIEILIYLGFLRTVSLESDKRQSPLSLLQKGKHFFWRFCGLGLLYVIVLVLLRQAIFFFIRIGTPIDGSLKEAAPVVALLCLSIAQLILIKLYLFIPALIIVLDCGAFESFKFLRQCKLSEAKELLAVYCAKIATSFVWLLLPTSGEIPIAPHIILVFSYYLIWNLLTLTILVMAIRFVVSLDLVYYGSAKDLNSEDLLRSATED